MKRIFKKNDDNKTSQQNDDFFTILEENEDEEKTKYKTVPHHVLTPDEVIAGFEEKKPSNVKSTGALDSLKKRIVSAVESKESNPYDNDSKEDSQNITQNEVLTKTNIQTKEVTEKEPITENNKKDVTEPKKDVINIPKASITQKDTFVSDTKKEKSYTENTAAESVIQNKPSLLDRCTAYIKDDEGKEANLNAEPPYKLQSVAEILQSNSNKTLQMLSDKYDIAFDDLGRKPKVSAEQEEKKEPETVTEQPEKPLETTTPEPESQEFEEKIKFKNIHSNVKAVISDIDIPYIPTSADAPKNTHDTATITFTPVSDKNKKTSGINISSKTRPIDLTGEIAELPEVSAEPKIVQLEKNEFEDYVPEEEFDCQKNSGKLIRKFSISKRNYFLISTVSIFLTVILSLTKLPFMSQLILSNTRAIMIVLSAITALIVICNGNMFASLKNIFNRRSSPDICASLASLTTIGYAVMGIISENVINDVLILLSIILSFRSLTAYYKVSYMLSNMLLIRGKQRKTAVKLIDDTAVTFAMSKNAIEGDVLIAAPQKTANISDFMKYSTFGTFLGGMLPILTIVSVILSIILGFACTLYFDGLVYGLYAAAAIQCFTSLPMVFFIDILPLYRANKKLKAKGGMIASKTAADHIEMSNAIVVEAANLFPAGKVTLHQMKVLSENNLEDTLVRAASLTENLGSSLAPIFKEIAGTGNITVLPDSDTVKYEDRMGISGWVDNRLLFIGNRTLMEAHSIEVPPVEVDRKILRQGYFPVYVATREKACALLIIQYSVDREIAKELRTLTASGVTLLVNSCDPNLIEEMICDYFGLYSDSVKVMSAAGSHMYKNAVSPAKSVSAPAVYRSNPLALAAILNCASKIKKSNMLLTVMYIISVVLGAVIFAYSSLGGSGNLISETTLLLYGAISTVVSYIIYFFARP